jgi:hypothetical protein
MKKIWVVSIVMSIFLWGSTQVRANPSSAAACDGVDQKFATTPTQPDSANALRLYQKNIASLPDQASMVMLGDSLVQAWPADLAASLSNGTVVNLGVGRDRIQNTMWFLTSFEGRLTTLHPKTVVLLLGTNNIYLDKPCAVELAFKTLFDRIHSLWPQAELVQIQILPRGANMQGAKDAISEVNTFLRNQAAETPPYVSVDASAIACQPGAACVNYREDLLHLTRPGYEQLQGILKSGLPKQ